MPCSGSGRRTNSAFRKFSKELEFMTTAQEQRSAEIYVKVAGVLLVVLGILLATGTYAHLTSYLARFTPAVGGL